MQAKKPRGSSTGGGGGELQGDEAQRAKKRKKKAPRFASIQVFLVSECVLMLAQGTVGAYLVSVLTTLERRFNLQSADVGVIASSFEIGNLVLILFVSYFGARGHRPRLIGCGGIIMALGALLSALPEFLTHQYEYESGEIRWRAEGRDVCIANGSTSEEGPDPDRICRSRTATNMMYLLLIGAQVLLGIGATPVQPLGVSYIDDHVKRKDSSLYIGILFTMLVFGPACGFILGSFCTKIYVDAVFIDTSKLDITPDDPRWIGAWWAGFLLCGALLFFSSLPMFGFPQSLTRRPEPIAEVEEAMLPEGDYERPKPSNGILPPHSMEANDDPSCFQQLRVIPKVTKHLLSNPVFTCIVLAACMEIAVVAGFAAFLGKYLEQQFNLTTSSANQLLGMTAIPCACLGIFLGGLLVKKLSLSALGAIQMAMLVSLVSTACYVSFLFLGCDTGPVAGITVPYGNKSTISSLAPYSACNSNCKCQMDSFTPVCGTDGITYLSACFAGCTNMNLTGCTCLTLAPARDATVVPGKCPSPGCQEAFLTFLCVMCVCSMIGAMAQTPSVIILIRNSGGRGAVRSAVSSLPSRTNRTEGTVNGSSSPAVAEQSNDNIKHHDKTVQSQWIHNQTLSLTIRKHILKFLDAEKDISVLKGTLKPGDIIHYVFDRDSTMNISQNLYALLPRTSPLKGKHYRTCAIVGNSGILLNSGCGKEIDTHSFVIRCNLAPVQEYTHDVGTKTDLVTMNPSVIQRAFEDLVNDTWREKLLQRLHSLNGSILWIPAFMAKGGKERVEWVNELILKHHINVRTAYPSLRLLHAVRGYWLTNKVYIKRPTTGLLMYTLATRFCNQIYLYGFWPFPQGPDQNPVKYHYYDSLKYGYMSQASPHTMPLEFKALKLLHHQGALKLTVGPCNGTT